MKHDGLQELLGQLQTQLALGANQRDRLLAGSQTPWWLSALLGLAAWFSAFFFILAFLGPWLLLIEWPVGRGLAGVLLLLAALWLFRRGQPYANQIVPGRGCWSTCLLNTAGSILTVRAGRRGSAWRWRAGCSGCLPRFCTATSVPW